jgi:hypothetical protein
VRPTTSVRANARPGADRREDAMSTSHSQQIDTGDNLSQILAKVQQCLQGRVRNLRLVLDVKGIVLQGQALTYYVKQLAQHAVLTAIDLPILRNEIEVILDPWPHDEH